MEIFAGTHPDEIYAGTQPEGIYAITQPEEPFKLENSSHKIVTRLMEQILNWEKCNLW